MNPALRRCRITMKRRVSFSPRRRAWTTATSSARRSAFRRPRGPQRPTGSWSCRPIAGGGTECCRHLFGDWSFAAWNAREQRLFLARDHLGNTGLFYYFRPPLIVFASDPGAILAHPEVPCEIDELRLARNLGLDMPDVGPSRTYWKDVSLIPAAHTATLTSKGAKVGSYWRLEEAPRVSLSSQEDCLEGFLEQFRRAVRVRLNSVRPVGSQLSAGLDSGAVTALAARELQEANRPLAAFTSVPLHPAEKIFPGNLDR